MSNRAIRWLIGFGIIAILAILAVQVYFFYKAFDLRQRQTVQSLRISLQSVAESICRYNECTLADNIIHQFLRAIRPTRPPGRTVALTPM